MKTPREVLLKRHESVQTKLDKVRAEALIEISPATGQSSVEPCDAQRAFWLWELIRSFRPHLAGLAGIWLVILGLHLASRETSEGNIVVTAAPSPEVIATLRVQRQLYSQLIGSSETTRPPEPALPDRRPRSEEKQLVRIV